MLEMPKITFADVTESSGYNPKMKFQIVGFYLKDGIAVPDFYVAVKDGVITHTLRREQEFGGMWVVRTYPAGNYVNHDQYRNDLFEMLDTMYS